MADVRPFRGARYNKQLVSDLASVICPPYDVIALQMEQELHHRSEYNFVRIEHGRPGRDGSDRYTHARGILERWLRQGVLKVDEVPAIYLHDHYFTYRGKECRRRGIIASVRLEEWDKMVIRPHEGTLGKAKEDRLSLLWALQSNTSPILALFDDREERRIASLLASVDQNKPLITLNSATEGRHNIWAMTESRTISQMCNSLAQEPLYIADGHHRYESALNYRRERQGCSSSVSGKEEFNFVMMTLVDFADPGLIILPPHRLVRGISRATLNELKTGLASFFEVAELPLSSPSVWQQVDGLLSGRDEDQVRIVLFGLSPASLLVLKLSDVSKVSQMMPYFHSEIYKGLGISILDHVILEELLGLSSESDEASLAFSYDREDAITRVLEEEYQLAFLLGPVRAEVIKAIADAGDRMPRKSTYFYPKLPSGLIFRLLA